jgi:hypothetical protein
MRPMDGEIV